MSALWIEFTDSSGEEGSSRWGEVSDEQIDMIFEAALRILGRAPDTTT